jgi:hypothetical protein
MEDVIVEGMGPDKSLRDRMDNLMKSFFHCLMPQGMKSTLLISKEGLQVRGLT